MPVIAITPALKEYADAQDACAAYSIAHPEAALKDNPHWAAVQEAARAIGGVWICRPCGRVNPSITDDLTTACCGQTEVDLDQE